MSTGRDGVGWGGGGGGGDTGTGLLGHWGGWVAYSGIRSLSHLSVVYESRVAPLDGCTYLGYRTAR